jgi:hypothetical protein
LVIQKKKETISKTYGLTRAFCHGQIMIDDYGHGASSSSSTGQFSLSGSEQKEISFGRAKELISFT